MSEQASTRRPITTALTVLLGLCAVVVTGLAVAQELRRRNPPPASTSWNQAQPDWLTYVAPGQRIGPSDARVVVVMFSDYQCPWCLRMEERLRGAREAYGGNLAVVYRHFPLTARHPHAMHAAIASECAAQQGRFAAMHAALFAGQDSLGWIGWNEFAARATVRDLPAFGVCMGDATPAAAVERDRDAAARLGATGTPVLLIDGRRYLGAMPQAMLDSLIEVALTRTDAQRGSLRAGITLRSLR